MFLVGTFKVSFVSDGHRLPLGLHAGRVTAESTDKVVIQG